MENTLTTTWCAESLCPCLQAPVSSTVEYKLIKKQHVCLLYSCGGTVIRHGKKGRDNEHNEDCTLIWIARDKPQISHRAADAILMNKTLPGILMSFLFLADQRVKKKITCVRLVPADRPQTNKCITSYRLYINGVGITIYSKRRGELQIRLHM